MPAFRLTATMGISQILLFATYLQSSLSQTPFLSRAPRFGGVRGSFLNLSYVNIPDLPCNGTHCQEHHDAIRRQRTEQIKRTVLSSIGMGKPPNVSVEPRDPSIRKAVQKVLERDREEVHYRASIPNTQRGGEITEIVSFGEQDLQIAELRAGAQKMSRQHADNLTDQHLIRFTLSRDRDQSSMQVVSASLFMLIRYKRREDDPKNRRRVKVNIYHVEEPLTGHREEQMITSLDVLVRHTRWQKLIVPTTVVQKVLDSNRNTLHFRILCENCENNIEPVLALRKSFSRKRVRVGLHGLQKKRKLNKRRPFLFIQTVRLSKEHAIRRRSVNCGDQPRKGRCSKRKLYVSFKELGWDSWILAPEGYHANYCEGTCPRFGSPGLLSSGHANVLQRYSRRSSHFLRFCCSPKKMSPLTLIYLDENANIIKLDLPNMIVDDCGCV